MPTFRHGKSAVFKLDNNAASLQDISNVLNSISYPQPVDTGETTAFGKNFKTYIVGLRDTTVSLAGMFDATVDAQFSSLLGFATLLNYQYGPAGSTTGFVRYSGTCIVTSYQLQSAVGGVVTFSASLQSSDTVTRDTWP